MYSGELLIRPITNRSDSDDGWHTTNWCTHSHHATYTFSPAPAALGAALYMALLDAKLPVPRIVIVLLPWALALATRVLAWTYRLALPHWVRRCCGAGLLPSPSSRAAAVVVAGAQVAFVSLPRDRR